MAYHVIGDDVFCSIVVQASGANDNINPTSLSGAGAVTMQGIAKRIATHSTSRKVSVKGMQSVAQANVYTDFEGNVELDSFVTSSNIHNFGLPPIGRWVTITIGAGVFNGVVEKWSASIPTGDTITVNISVNLNVDYIA